MLDQLKRFGESNDVDDIGSAALKSVRRIGPNDRVMIHHLDRSSAGLEWDTFGQSLSFHRKRSYP